jgi:hypothetical protein
MSDLTKAIKSLKPNAEFSFQENDYSTIQWDVLDGSAPTQKEIDDAIKQIKIVETTEAEAKATARAAILDRLGLTAEEAALFLS